MKKLVLTLVVILLALDSYAPFDPYTDRYMTLAIESTENQLIQQNLSKLTDNTRKTRTEVYHLVQPIIEIYLNRGEYKGNFPYIQDSISHALACIFVSESSNGFGHSAKSSLWLNHNNPFGLTSSKGVTKMSWEMVKGQRVSMYITFRTFNTFYEAFESLLWDYLLKEGFLQARQSTNIKEFLDNLYECGYMTNHKWPDFAYYEIYLKSLHEKV